MTDLTLDGFLVLLVKVDILYLSRVLIDITIDINYIYMVKSTEQVDNHAREIPSLL